MVSRVERNTEALIKDLRSLIAKDSDSSQAAIGVEPAQALDDLTRLGELISSRQPEQGPELEGMHRRYLGATPPKKGCTGYLDHPFKNKPCEAEKDHLPRLANTGWSVYNQTSSTEYSCSNDAIFM
jgi:hypothetical protein